MARRTYLGKASQAVKSVAGTLGEGARSAKETVRSTLERRRARRDLEGYRDEEVQDQEQARIERAEMEARREAKREAQQEFVDEYREAVKERERERELEDLRERRSVPGDENGEQDTARQALLGPPPQPDQGAAPRLPEMSGPMAEEGTQPGLPGMGLVEDDTGFMDTDGDGQTHDRDQPTLPRLW